MRKPTRPSSAATRHGRLAAAVRPLVEAIEQRTMLSATLANGVLTVTGTAGADTIAVTLADNAVAQKPSTIAVVLNGSTQTFAAAGVNSLVVSGGDGNDTVNVGVANTEIDYRDGSPLHGLAVSVNSGGGADSINVQMSIQNGANYLEIGSVALDGGDGNDAVTYDGETGSTLHGGAGDDTLTAGGGTVIFLYGDAGNDSIIETGYTPGYEYAHVDGGDGNDTFAADDSFVHLATIHGGAGVDTIILPARGDNGITGTVLSLNAGQSDGNLNPDDTVENVTALSQISPSSLTVIGNASANTFDFSRAVNTLNLVGLGGNDRLIGPHSSPATLNGGDGNDTLVSGGESTLIGGLGTDVADYSAYDAGVTVHLDGSAKSGLTTDPNDAFDGTVEQVYGSAYADTIYGTKGNNALYGNGGNDTLVANGGTDALFGGDGNDTAYADDGGATYADGGGGTDTAYVDPAGDTTVNTETVIKRTAGVPAPAVLANGVLTVTGTAGADTIAVFTAYGTDANGRQTIGVSATVNGTTQQFSATPTQPITAVVINGGDGNDTLTYNASAVDYPQGTLGITAALNGGAGNDRLTIGGPSSQGNNVQLATLHGGDGNDTLVAGDYPLEVQAYEYGDGGDDLLAAVGLDTRVALYGGDGNDRFINYDFSNSITVGGGAGIDTILLTATPELPYSGGNIPDGTVDLTSPTTLIPDLSLAGGGGRYVGETDVENVTGTPNSFDGGLTVIGNGLANTIAVSDNGYPVSISGGDGNDSLSLLKDGQPAPATINGGGGNDTIFAADGASTTVDGGPGTDTAMVDPYGDTVVNVETVNGAYLPNGPVYLANGVLTVTGTAGADTIDVRNLYYVTTVVVNGATYTFPGTVYGTAAGSIRSIVVNAGDGNDTVTFGRGDTVDGILPSVQLNGGGGADAITFQADNPVTVDGGAGDDTLYASGAVYAPSVVLLGGTGDDQITVDFDLTATVNGGDGNDVVRLNAPRNSAATVSGGSGTDRLEISSDFLTGTGAVTVNLDGTPSTFEGVGNDRFNADVENLTVLGPDVAADLAINGNGSANVITATNTGGRTTIHGGAGNDTITIAGGVSSQVFGDAGDDTINAADGQATSVDGGTGYDTATVDPTGDTVTNVEVVNGVATTPTPTVVQLTGTTIGAPGSYNNSGNTAAKATDGNLNTFYDAATGSGGFVGLDLGTAHTVSQIRYAPRAGYAYRVPGGVVQASNSADFAGAVTALTITATPADGRLTSAAPTTSTAYRYWRYVGPPNTNSNLAEFQLFGPATTTPSATRLTGTTFGTAGSYANGGNTVAKATDDNLSTYFDAPTSGPAVIGVDLGSAQVVTQVKYAPRAGYADRAVGGVVQASSTADFASPLTVFTVTQPPAEGVLTTVNVSAGSGFRYWRFVTPAGGYGNLAEFQLFGPGSTTPTATQLTGTSVGSPGSYANGGNTATRATDGNLSTYFDAQTGSGSFTGLDLGVAHNVTQVGFAPRAGYAGRLVGGVVQASNAADFAGAVTVYRVTTAPAEGSVTKVAVSAGSAYRYWRYVGPADGYGNIAEFQLFGY